MNWRLDLMQKNLLLFGSFRNVFVTHSFCKWPLCTLQLPCEQCLLRSSSQGTLQPAKGKYTCAISKNHENLWISQTQCWTLFVISKATFPKTAIKPKFVDRFSLKEFQCCNWSVYYKIPEFRVHWKLFKLSNVGAKLSKYWSDVIDLAKFLLWDFLLPRF